MGKRKDGKFSRFIIPVINILKDQGGSGTPSEVTDATIELLNISEEELSENLKNGTSKIRNQIAWARMYLVNAGYIDSSRKNTWSLTEKGSQSNLTDDEVFKLVANVRKQGALSVEKTTKDKQEIAVVDIETSGFQKQGGLIVEIGIVGLNLETGEMTNEFDAVVKEKGFGEKHTKNPFGWVFQNSDLKFNDVLLANELTDMLSTIQGIFDKYSQGATAFNKHFDFSFLKSRGFKIKELPCIMLSAAPVVALPPNPGYYSPKWPKVEEAWEYFFPNIAYKEAHRALDDARHEALIVHALYKLGKFKI